MSCRGVHFSLDERTVARLRRVRTDSARMECVQEEIEEEYFEEHQEWFAETDKAWDAIHRSLTDGTLGWDNGTYPLNHVILAGEQLYKGDDYIMSLKTPAQIRDIAAALQTITETAFREAYFRIDPRDYGEPLTAEDCDYTWGWFAPLRAFFAAAATEGRWVLFTVDQ
jgi:hypothetical protein